MLFLHTLAGTTIAIAIPSVRLSVCLFVYLSHGSFSQYVIMCETVTH